MHKKMFKKSSVMSAKQREELLIETAHKSNLLMTICVLHDCFGFGSKRINEFVDRYSEFAKSFHYGNEDLKAISKDIDERFGIRIL